jgi:hypothetical protein
MPNRRFAHRVVTDDEFMSRPGERPDVVCCVFKIDGEPTRVLWRDELGSSPPYSIGDDTLVVSFTQAEWSCHLSLHWKLPKHVIDLNCELRMMSNGLKLPAGQSLIGFCRWLGLDAGDAAVKDAVRGIVTGLSLCTSFSSIWKHWKWRCKFGATRASLPGDSRANDFGMQVACR